MPLIVVTGLPSSGKTSTAEKLREYLESRGKVTQVVGEGDLLGGLTRDQVFGDSREEKEVRGRLKSEVIRLLSKENVVICDGLNYIKGFRYELYCASKASKTTQVTVQCDLSPQDCEEINCGRVEGEGYSQDILSGLVQRYEAPVSSNRWDSPLYLVLKDGEVQCEAIHDSLFLSKPPPPNMSTQNKPLSSTNFVYELDKMTAGVVQAVMEAQKAGSSVTVPGVSEKVVLARHYTLPELARTKRQFLVYVKQNSCQDLAKLTVMFVQYLNANLTL